MVVKSILKMVASRVITRSLEHPIREDLAITPVSDHQWEVYYDMSRLSSLIYDEQHILERKLNYIADEFEIKEISNTKVIMYRSDRHKQYVLIVRGTSNFKNILTNLRYYKDKSERLQCKIHTGFHRISEKIYDEFSKFCVNKDYEIIATGHSLGGAVALITSLYCEYHGYKVREVVTFGQPKITDTDGVELLHNKINLTRIVNETDVIQYLPPLEPFYYKKRYSHFGKLVKLCNTDCYTVLDYPESGDNAVNSFWLSTAKDNFSFSDFFKDVSDHKRESYVTRLKDKREVAKIVTWNNCEKFHD